MPFANSVTLVLALRRDLRHLDKELGASTSGIFERNLTWRQNNFDDEPEGAWRGYGERGSIRRRPKQGATIIMKLVRNVK